jgi:NAD-dependent deacetylase
VKPNIVVFTGAGISAESGLKTFRDSDGLWENYRIEDVATPEAWAKDPALVQDFYNMRRKAVMEAQPNPAHYAIAQLEKQFNVQVITQNIDDLHERAGSSNVLHLHGHIMYSKSSIYDDLRYRMDTWELKMGERCEKGYQLRPHVVWFGEAVPELINAEKIAAQADIFIVIGTSLQVYPAALLVYEIQPTCKLYVVDKQIPDSIKKQVSPLNCFEGKASEQVPRLLEEIVLSYEC